MQEEIVSEFSPLKCVGLRYNCSVLCSISLMLIEESENPTYRLSTTKPCSEMNL